VVGLIHLVIGLLVLALVGWLVLHVLALWGAPPIARTVVVVVLCLILLVWLANTLGGGPVLVRV
jgi:hypothetical protein